MGSEMCIRDRDDLGVAGGLKDRTGGLELVADRRGVGQIAVVHDLSLIHTDAADERSSVDLGGRRIIKKKKSQKKRNMTTIIQKNTQSQQSI